MSHMRCFSPYSITGNRRWSGLPICVFNVPIRIDLMDRSFYGEAFHQVFELFRGEAFCLVGVFWPLEAVPGGKSFGQESITVTFPHQAAAAVPFYSAEQKQCPFFQCIDPVIQLDEGSEAIDPPPQVDTAAADDDFAEADTIPKHGR